MVGMWSKSVAGQPLSFFAWLRPQLPGIGIIICTMLGFGALQQVKKVTQKTKRHAQVPAWSSQGEGMNGCKVIHGDPGDRWS